MKFGTTYDEQDAREKTWRRAFAWLPVDMHDGTRLWLEAYEYRSDPLASGAYGKIWLRRPVGSDWEWTWPAPPPAFLAALGQEESE